MLLQAYLNEYIYKHQDMVYVYMYELMYVNTSVSVRVHLYMKV